MDNGYEVFTNGSYDYGICTGTPSAPPAMDCPAGEYMDIFFTCQACGVSCATCGNGVTCETCADGYTYEGGLCCQGEDCSGSSGGGTEP